MADQFFSGLLSGAFSTVRGPSFPRRSSRSKTQPIAPADPTPALLPKPRPPPAPKPQPPVAPREFPKPPSQDRPLAKTAKTGKRTSAASDKSGSSRASYTAWRWFIEVSCCVFVVLAVIWGTVQLFGLLNLLGVSREPPGLVHSIENAD